MNRYAHIDAICAFAMLIAVFTNIAFGITPGALGMTPIFTVAGFLITFYALKERDHTGTFDMAGFATRRLMKISPPFVLLIGVPTLFYTSGGGDVDDIDFVGQVVSYYNFQLMYRQDPVLPGSEAIWGLSVVMQFYLFFLLVWPLLVGSENYYRHMVKLCLAIVFGSAVLRVVLLISGASEERIGFGTDARAEALFVGVFAALWYHRYRNDEMVLGREIQGRRYSVDLELNDGRTIPLLSKNWVPLTCLAAFTLPFFLEIHALEQTLNYTLQAWSTAGFILWGLVAARQPLGQRIYMALLAKPIQVLGRANYSIYLVHGTVAALVLPQLTSYPAYVRVSLALIASVLVGMVAFSLIELPAQYIKRRFLTATWRKREAAAAAPPEFTRRARRQLEKKWRSQYVFIQSSSQAAQRNSALWAK